MSLDTVEFPSGTVHTYIYIYIVHEELIVVFNHNVINLYLTANKKTMYTSYFDKVYELL